MTRSTLSPTQILQEAYDESSQSLRVSGLAAPWTITLPAWQVLGNTTWSTFTKDDAAITNGYRASSSSVGSAVWWDLGLAAGTWDIEPMYTKSSDAGIITVQIDGTTVGTIDTVGTLTYNVRSMVQGVAVATSGKHRLTLAMLTKAGGSAGYSGYLQEVQLRRTA